MNHGDDELDVAHTRDLLRLPLPSRLTHLAVLLYCWLQAAS